METLAPAKKKPYKDTAWDRLREIRMKERAAQPEPTAGSQEDFEAGFNFLMDAMWGRINRTIRQRSSPTTVYIFRAANGQALYVGVSMEAAVRIRSHKNRYEDFWWQTAHICLEHFPNRRSALNREAQLIAELQPVHNIAKGTIK